MQKIIADWPAPKNIHAFTTTRQDGFSQSPWDSFNLATHVDDNLQDVEKNREKLTTAFDLPQAPVWLNQTHSNNAAKLDNSITTIQTPCDAAYTMMANLPCTVMTADCLPLLVCNRQGTEVAAIHAGWRGILNGMIESTIQKLSSKPEDLLVWLGPAIGPEVFELGNDIRLDFLEYNAQNSLAFKQVNGAWLANIYQLGKNCLLKCGVTQVFGGEHCTFTEESLFFSYRRDNITGRMASIIWFT